MTSLFGISSVSAKKTSAGEDMFVDLEETCWKQIPMRWVESSLVSAHCIPHEGEEYSMEIKRCLCKTSCTRGMASRWCCLSGGKNCPHITVFFHDIDVDRGGILLSVCRHVGVLDLHERKGCFSRSCQKLLGMS